MGTLASSKNRVSQFRNYIVDGGINSRPCDDAGGSRRLYMAAGMFWKELYFREYSENLERWYSQKLEV